MQIHVYENPEHNKQHPWVETNIFGRPYHPRTLLGRVRSFVKNDQDCATCSDVVLAAASYMVRAGESPLLGSLLYHHENGEERCLCFDIRGDLVEPWPESGMDSIMDVAFHLRFSGPHKRELSS